MYWQFLCVVEIWCYKEFMEIVYPNLFKPFHFPKGCFWCLKQTKLTKDHIVPHSMGGSNRMFNIVMACYECNQSRGLLVTFHFLKPAKKLPKIKNQERPKFKKQERLAQRIKSLFEKWVKLETVKLSWSPTALFLARTNNAKITRRKS